jgi:hypothetical protein
MYSREQIRVQLNAFLHAVMEHTASCWNTSCRLHGAAAGLLNACAILLPVSAIQEFAKPWKILRNQVLYALKSFTAQTLRKFSVTISLPCNHTTLPQGCSVRSRDNLNKHRTASCPPEFVSTLSAGRTSDLI